MDLLDRIAKDSRLKLRNQPNQQPRTTDELLGILQALSEFNDRLEKSESSDIILYDENEFPRSNRYNDVIQRLVTDMNTIREHQQNLINRLLIAWNTSEEILIEAEQDEELIDKDFPTSSPAGKANGDITLAVSEFSSAIPVLTNPPVLNAVPTDQDVIPVFGKAYGLFVEGNETGEDGVRPNNNDGSLIVDNLDSFWEAEVVTLQETMVDAFSSQEINDKELSLTVNIILTFNNPVNINSFTILPHNFAQSVYYDITDIQILSGSQSIPVLTEPVTSFRESRIAFNTMKANGMQITLRQDKGYFLKFHQGRFKIGNNEDWIDFTGPHLVSRVDKTTEDINAALNREILNAGAWIPSIWIPNAPSIVEAERVISAGNNGFRRIESVASRRKRWAIGIQDINFGQEVYESVSEVVSVPHTMPEETTSVFLKTDEETPDGTSVTYFLSFDDGNSWNLINPINRPPEQLETGHIVPQRIFINSDKSQTRRENTLTGLAGFVNTSNRAVRVRAIMEKDDDVVNTPRIKSFTPVFDTSVPE